MTEKERAEAWKIKGRRMDVDLEKRASEEGGKGAWILEAISEQAGLRVVHEIEKGAVFLTLQDRGILHGDAQASQQVCGDAPFKKGHQDKFQDVQEVIQRAILPEHYDEGLEGGMASAETGSLSEGRPKKLEDLRKKLQGVEQKAHGSLSVSLCAVASDFYTQEEEMLPSRKKQQLRKKEEKIDLDSLEAEAKAKEWGHGSRFSSARHEQKLEKENTAEESCKSAYMNARTGAVDASQKLRLGSAMGMTAEEAVAFGGEEEEGSARQAALKKSAENRGVIAGPRLVVSALHQAMEMEMEMENQMGHADDKDKTAVVFTETHEFCRNILLDEVLARGPVPKVVFGAKDVFRADDKPVEEDKSRRLDGGWIEVNEDNKDQEMGEEPQAEEDPSIEEAVKEVSVGKGLSGALQLLKERGALKEMVEWGGQNMHKKKRKRIGIVDQEDKFKNREILLDRVDEFGRILSPREDFREVSHRLTEKGPGKMKQEKRVNQDTPLLPMERMRNAQAQLHTPYTVISGRIKSGQTHDPLLPMEKMRNAQAQLHTPYTVISGRINT